MIIINRGKIAAQGTAAEIADKVMKTGKMRLEVRGDGRAIKESLENVPGIGRILSSSRGDDHTFLLEVEPGPEPRQNIVKCAAAQGWDLLEFGPESITLEDLFTLVTQMERSATHVRQPAAVTGAPPSDAGGPRA